MTIQAGTATEQAIQASGQFATFFVDGLFFGIEVVQVQEVLRYQEMTPVPLAPDVVEGLINLRGQIVTAVDMRRRLRLQPRPEGQTPMNTVVRTPGGAVSLLVDEIGDVVEVDPGTFEQTPDNVDPAARELLTGEIAKNIGGVAMAAQNTTKGAADTQKAAQALSAMAAQLQMLVSKFTF